MSEAKALSKPFLPVKELLNDYRLACESREASLLGRKEVFKGKLRYEGLSSAKKYLRKIKKRKLNDLDYLLFRGLIHEQHAIANRLISLLPGAMLYWYHFKNNGQRIDTSSDIVGASGHFLYLLHQQKPNPFKGCTCGYNATT